MQMIASPTAAPQRPVPQVPPITEETNARTLVDLGRKLYVSAFLREPEAVRSLGFVSPSGQEGTTFLVSATATAITRDSDATIVLADCNWQHPDLHRRFGLPLAPGLAEWLRGECGVGQIRHRVSERLTVICAGDHRDGEIRLLKQLRANGLSTLLPDPDGLLLIDLPPVLSTGYGTISASLVDALVLVARAYKTTQQELAQTRDALAELPVRGVVLNRVERKLPRWIERLI